MTHKDRDEPRPDPESTTIDPPTVSPRRTPAPTRPQPLPTPPQPQPNQQQPPTQQSPPNQGPAQPGPPPPPATTTDFNAGRPAPRPPAPPPTAAEPGVDPEKLVLQDVHGDSRLRRVGRAAVRPFRPADEMQRIAEHGRWIQHPVTTGRRIAVIGVRGGTGKSTVAALVASVFARYRQDRVLALDVDPERGSLPLRLGLRGQYTLTDLARAELATASFDQVEPYLAHPLERLWALPGTRGPIGGAALSADTYRSTGIPLTRFFGVTITDSGAGIRTELHRAVLRAAHAQVLVATATPEGAASVGHALDWMAANGLQALHPRTIVVFTAHSPTMAQGLDVKRASEVLTEVGAGVVRMGYDRHMAVGAALDPSRLAQATHVTAVTIAAEALRRSVS
ncbi:AAA family ATPase [Spirillospora sp. CA-294931]|uniref:AAA family ATPase n=1 Tax=Spirillospora sp. CA-294931 TaxID=3240042 RepID=UPI003D94DA01